MASNNESLLAVPDYPQSRAPLAHPQTTKPAPADLHSQQSALLPIARLSDDDLFHIFSFLAQTVHIIRYRNEPPDFRDVVRASQVCSRWRTVALAPSLWTHIPLRNLGETQALLSRSENALIRVTMECPVTSAPGEFRTLLAPHIHRIRSFRVIESSREIRAWISLLTTPAPHLEELSLSIKKDHAYRPRSRILSLMMEDLQEAGSSFESPVHLSALRYLDLQGVYFPPGSPIFQHLRDLRLTAQPIFRLSSTTVAHIVSHIPQLETLYVSRVGDDLVEDRIANTSFSAALPRLRTLTVHTVPPCFPGNLLDALVLPLTVRINLRVSVENNSDPVPIPRFTAQFTPTCVGARALNCVIGCEHFFGFITLRTRRDPAAPDPDLTLRIDTSDMFRRIGAVLAEEALVDGSALERYTLEYKPLTYPPHTPRWAYVLAQMPGLRVLTVVDSQEEHLFELFEALRLCGNEADWHAPLEEIRLRGVEGTEAFWSWLRVVAETRQPTLRTIRISRARGMTDVAHSMAREVERLVETFELRAQ